LASTTTIIHNATAYHQTQNRQAWSMLVGTATSIAGQATWWWWWWWWVHTDITHKLIHRM